MKVDQRSFNFLKPKPSWEHEQKVKDLNEYASCVADMLAKGRYEVDAIVKKHGFARVVQALAAVIVRNRPDYDFGIVELAKQIPMPALTLNCFVDWHRAFVQGEFDRLIKMHLA